MARKVQGRFTGWIGFSLSKSARRFENVNNGNPFPFDYDRRCELNCFGQYSFNENINMGLTWIYATGIPANIPKWRYDDIDGNVLLLYDGYNSSRQKDYHRLDLSLNLKGERGDWNISIMNLYNRRNTYYYQVVVNNNQPVLKEKSLYTIIPTLSYTFRF
jgi:hypothetical protein